MKTNERMRKVFSILLCLCMVLQYVPTTAFAVDAAEDGLCEHHTEHTADCGYVEAVAGQPCAHEHSETCYAVLACVHEQEEHDCTVESGCVTMALDCHHTHGDCGYSEGTAEVPCGHVHNESCGYVEAVAGNPCANAETAPECDHSGDCGYVAAFEGQPCGHTEHTDCGYAPATEGTPCTHTHAVKVGSADSCYKLLCSHADGGHDDACGYVAATPAHECHYECAECAAALTADETTEPSTEPAPVCDCGTDDESVHATTCAVYVAPETAVCYCTEKCSDTNVWCDVCGFDYTQCGGTDMAVPYADCTCETKCTSDNVNSDCTVCSAEGTDLTACAVTDTTADTTYPYAVVDTAAGTVTIDGTLGGKDTVEESDITALVDAIKGYVDSGITTISVTGSEPALYNFYSVDTPAVSVAIFRLTEDSESSNGSGDPDSPYCGKIDLILQDVTEIVEMEFHNSFALNSITLPKVTKLAAKAFTEILYLRTITFGSVLTEVNETSDISVEAMFHNVGKEVGGCDLFINCGQMNESSVPAPDLTTKTWTFTYANEFKSITLTHTISYQDLGNGTHSFECSVCGATGTEDHSGGEATCTTLAICSGCGVSYGEVDPDNHTAEPAYTVNEFDSTQHDAYYSCCGATVTEDHHGTPVAVDEFYHKYEGCCDAVDHTGMEPDGICDVCGFAQYDVWVDAIQITSLNKDDVLNDGGSLKYAPDTYTLTVSGNVTVNDSFNDGINSYVIYSKGSIIITGDENSSLTVVSEITDYGVYVDNPDGKLEVTGGMTLNATGSDAGIQASVVEVKNASVINASYISAAAKVVSADTTTYYATLSAALNAGGNVYALADYSEDFTIPDTVTFYGGEYSFGGAVTNNGTIESGTFNGSVTNSADGKIYNNVSADAFTLGDNFSITNNGTIECTYHHWKNGKCRLCASECDHSGSQNESATDKGDGTHSFTCTVCGDTVIENHSGGEATCQKQAVCVLCGTSYGELNSNNHESEEFTYTANEDGTTHTKKRKCCDAVADEAEAHDHTNGKCACGVKATPAVTAPTAVSGLEYTGEALTLINAGNTTGGTMQYKVDDGEWSTELPKATNAGTYTVSYKVVGNENYNDVAETSFTVTIGKATPTVTAPNAKTLTYNGQAQALVTAVSTTGGEMQYCTIEDGTYGSDIPIGTNAGTYTVWYKVVGGNNYNDVAAKSVTVTISPKEVTAPTFAELKENYLYQDGAEIKPTFKLMDGETEITASEYTVAYSNNTAVGTATITITDNEGGNYTVSGSATFEIVVHTHNWSFHTSGTTITATCANTDGYCPDTEQSVTLVVPENFTYTGDATPRATIEGNIDGVTRQVFYKGENTNYDSVDEPRNADTYTVTLLADSASVSDTFTISPKNIANCRASLAKDSFTYTGTAPELTMTVVDNGVGSATLTKDTDYTVGTISGINVGDHKLTVTGKGNYTGTVELDYTITAKEVTITGAEIEGVTYDPDGYTLTVTNVTFNGVVEGENLDYTATAALTGTNAVGDQEATVTVVLKDSNYTLATATYKTTVNISKADAAVTAAPTAKELTYTSSAQALVTEGEAKGGEMQYSLDGTNYSTTIPTGTNAKTYTVYYYVKGDSNHNDTTPDSLTVTIGKANPNIGTVSYSGETLYDSTDISTVALSRSEEAIRGMLVLTDEELTVDEETYNWKFTPEDTENYNTITGTVTLTVAADVLEKIEASGTLSKSNYTYGESFAIDGLTVTATYTSGATKDVTKSVIFNEDLAVGQTSVELTYQGKSCTVTGITVAKKQIVISGIGWEVPENPTYRGTVYTAVLKGTLPEGVTVTKTGDTGIDAGDYTAKAVFSLADGYSADNYVIVNGEDLITEWSIGKKDIAEAEVVLGDTLTYNGKEQTQEVTKVEIDGLTVTYTVSGNTGTDAGDYTLTVTGTGNFEGTATKEWSIAKKNISGASITLDGSLTYNGSEQTMEVTEVKIDGLTVTYDVSGNEQTNADSYTLTVTGNGNFEGSATAGWSISKAALTVTAKDHTITYGNAPSANGVSYDGFVNGESEAVLGGELTYSYSYEQYGDIGTYTITPSGLTSGNYEITFKTGTLTVNAKEITVTANAVSKTYGDADPELTYKVEGLVNGDKLSGALTRAAGTDVGTYAITQGTLTAGSNYTINYTGATLTINKKAITEADVTLNGSLTYTGEEQTQPITVTEGITYTVTGDKATNVGTYELTVKGTGNYTGSVNVEWIIAKAAVTITADNKVIYVGAGLPTLTYTVSGLMEGDELTKEPTLTTDADEDQAGSYVITVANADAGNNYEISYVGGTLTVMDAETEVETRIEKTELTEVPDGLKNTEFNTVEAITEELVSRILAASTGYSEENMEHYDVTLQFSLDGGNTWILATEENFPTEGITVTLPYPEGTTARDYEFVVSHMFTVTSQRLGTTAGDVELPKVEETANGIRVTLNGLSPVTVAARYHDHIGGTATCTEKAVCTICGNAYGEVVKTNHAGGTEVKDAKEATCGAEGYTGDTYCKSCGEITEKGTTIKATGEHTYGNWKVVKEATKTAKGEKQRTCSVCGHVDSKEIPVLSDTPATGDDSNLMLWSGLLCVSTLGLVVLLADRKRRKATK